MKKKKQRKIKPPAAKKSVSNMTLLAEKMAQTNSAAVNSKNQDILQLSRSQETNSSEIETKYQVQSTKYQDLQGWVSYAIFLQALVAMLGSLYFSTFGDPAANIAAGNLFPVNNGLVPCELCWFARILMYPIVFISAVGMIKNDRRFTNYVLPLAIPGIALEIFHYSLQKFSVENPFGCTLTNPCDAIQVQYLGFITIPFLCLTAFTIITILSLVNVWLNRQIDNR